MYHQILTYRGYDHLNLPDVTRYDALVSAADHASNIINIGRVAYGREITVSIGRSLFAGTADWSDPTYLAVWQDGSGLHLIYTVTQVIDSATVDGGPAILIKGRLNGALTAKIAEGATSMVSWSEYTINRMASIPDSVSTAPHIVLGGDDVPGYVMQDYESPGVNYVYPSDYMVVITWLRLPGDDIDDNVVRDHRLIGSTAPYGTALYIRQVTGSGGGTDYMPTGTTAIACLADLLQGLGQDVNKIYRIQMVPEDIVAEMMAETSACVVNYSYTGGPTGKLYFAPLLNRYYHQLSSQSITPSWATVGAFEAYGQPRAIVRHLGQIILDLPLVNTQVLPALDMSIKWYIRGVVSSGVELAIEARQTDLSDDERVVARAALSVPDVMVTDNGLTVWQDTASRQWLSSAASVGVGLAISGGNPIGALAGLATGAVGMIASADQAAHEIKSAGAGAAGILAALGPWLTFTTRRYRDAHVAARDRWLRAHGVHVVDQRDSLNNVPGGVSYAYVEGSGRCVIDPQQLHNVAIRQEDLDAALTEDLAAGVRVWSVRPSPLCQTLNHPV